MSVLASLDWLAVRSQYDIRENTHLELRRLHSEENWSRFVPLLLGISDPSGNYSAAEHGIGPKVLAENHDVEKRLVVVVNEFVDLSNGHEVPPLIRRARLKYFQIGVGSEASCMVNPHCCWVANVRTIWTHLVHKHDDNFSKADAELKLYRESDVGSDVAGIAC